MGFNFEDDVIFRGITRGSGKTENILRYIEFHKSLDTKISSCAHKGLTEILGKAGFNDIYIIKNSIDNGWISIVEKHKPDKSLFTYCVSICGKLFAALDIRYKMIPVGDEIEIEVNSEITYFD